jgi:hypothetical protein
MLKNKWVWVIVLLLLVVGGSAAAGLAVIKKKMKPLPVEQPIAFNHARHAKEEIKCLDCHTKAATSAYATLPKISMCKKCHNEAPTDEEARKKEHPDLEKVREYVNNKKEIPWIQVNRVVGHVYFSHVAHVKYGEIDCAECHGDMSKSETPVVVSQIDHFTMGKCMKCHEERKANNGCQACHK